MGFRLCILIKLLFELDNSRQGSERALVMEKQREAVLLAHHVDEDESLPGFRFHPTDEELVGFYLRRKVDKKRLSIDIIKQVDIYKYDPWDLSDLSTIGVGEKEWYFFCLRGRKYRNSVRPNRVTGSGFWKATGIDKKIFFPVETNNCIGLKKSLVYYLGSAGKGNKTDWMMHEFRLPPKFSSDQANAASIYSDQAHEAENWTICRIFKRNASPKKSNTQTWKDPSSSHSPTPTDHASPNSSCIIDTMDQFGDHNCINQFASSALSPPNEEDSEQQYWNSTDQTAITGDVPLESISELSSRGFDELEDTNWYELGRILEFSEDPTLVCL